MTNGGLRVLLILTLAALLGAVALTLHFDNSIAAERDAAARVDRDLQSVDLALADWRAAQASYVAMGQGPGFWITRGGELASSIDTTLERMRSTTTSADARAHYDAAAASLGNLNTADRKARDYIGTDQRFLASDAIFMDAQDANHHLAAEVAAAATAERAQTDARLLRLGRYRFFTSFATLV